MIKSESDASQKYIGITEDLNKRLKDHNEGKSPHTSKYKPWKLIVSVQFFDKYKAYEFEKYMKSHSGRAFANKRFW